ncbi:hypothetical protein HXX76_005162 [Chlamydomonas incerta]|uniref:Uncharacterized protein n=1 Tax=Chlamydomonas incerta TaxID=51695 RepID=A0A835W603_CHLIN|nr:hypothetical protein HXX76_005162 [Chlamydomonas incerta]|eukprot:KAG2438613.1 hypothetical protein HXX76_005162 [Chlamydomonas incerta]
MIKLPKGRGRAAAPGATEAPTRPRAAGLRGPHGALYEGICCARGHRAASGGGRPGGPAAAAAAADDMLGGTPTRPGGELQGVLTSVMAA